jgi:6-phosphogluconate dehydrogenase
VARAKKRRFAPYRFHRREDLCSKLSKPRKIVILDASRQTGRLTIAALSGHMEEGDVIIDGGNRWYPNSIRRSEELAEKGIIRGHGYFWW